MKRAFAIVFAMLMLASMVALPLGGAVATASAQQSGPSGMVALGPEQVTEDLPSGTTVPLRASDLEGSVYAGSNAETLEIIVTTPDRAGQYMGSDANVIADDEVALVLRDQAVHTGRDVAVDIDVLEAAIGYVPSVAYGTHSSGEQWQSTITREGTVASWNIPKFSANTVTFTGGIELSGEAAGDGTQYRYDLDTLDGIGSYTINLTGVETTGPGSMSAAVSGNQSLEAVVGGTTAPKTANITLTGVRAAASANDSLGTLSDGASTTLAVDGNQPAENESITLTGVETTGSPQTDSWGFSGPGTEQYNQEGNVPSDATITVTGQSTSATKTGGSSGNVISAHGNGDRVVEKTIFEHPTGGSVDVDLEWHLTHSYMSGKIYFRVYDASAGYWDSTKIAGTGYPWAGNNHYSTTVDLDAGDKIAVKARTEEGTGTQEGTAEIESYSISYTSETGTVSADIAGETITSPLLRAGETWSTTLSDVPPGLRTVEVTEMDGKVGDVAVEHTPRIVTKDPSVSIDGSTLSHTGVLSDGQTVTLEGADMVPGSNPVSVSTGGGSSVDVSAAWTEVTMTENPRTTVNGQTVSHTGILQPGETRTDTISLTVGTNTLDVSSNGPVEVNTQWTEVTESINPTVRVNGHETGYTGTLDAGETVSLTPNEAWLYEGTNNVTVTTGSPSRGPESLVGVTYSHDAAGTTQRVEVAATSWTETFNLSRTYPVDTRDASATLTFVDDVAEIHDVEYRIDGGAWTEPPAYELNGTDLEVIFGDIAADTDLDVRATGYKIRSYDGELAVTQPTVEGDELATEVKITELDSDGQFGFEVSGTPLGDRLHYASKESWTGDSAYTSHATGGIQILHAEDANVGSTMTVRTMPLSVTPETGAIETVVEDPETPTFSLRTGETVGASRVNVQYFDTLPGDRYVLWSDTREVEVDADRAQSPVSFVTDGSKETYSVLQQDKATAASGAPAGGPIETSQTLPLLLVFVGVGAVLIGTTVVSRRRGIGGWLLPITATSLTLIAVHVLAPVSPLTRVAELAYQSNVVTIAAVGALLVAMWQLDERTSGTVPWYVRGIIGVLSVIWALETLSPGVILGGLRAGFDSMGPLIVIVLVGGGAYLIREWIQARRAPDTVVQFSAGNEEN